jgi:succinate dehydrogenase/fumarate reductase flavoprotein subunit
MGHIAGGSAARYALGQPAPKPLSREEIEKIREELVRPLESEGKLTPRGFEDEVREIVTGRIGFRRDENRLKSALDELSRLKGREGSVHAGNYHDLMRFYEAKNLRTVAETILSVTMPVGRK